MNFEHSHILYNNLFYSAKEYNELKVLYHEVCEELKQIKLSI